ncbi:MAG: hypothetical protein JNN18_09760 [Rubrivivax sp.]|nr:hypothetical protein [Rubrivivax sp.]
MLIKSKSLSDAAWKDLVAKHKLKDNGLLKVLEKLKKFGDEDFDDALKALDEASKLAGQLKKDKAIAAAPPAAKYIGDLLGAADTTQREITKSKADADKKKAEADKKAAEAAKRSEAEDGDDEEETPELLTTKLKPLLRLVMKGETVHALLAKAGKRVVVMLSRKPIPPARRKLLNDQLGGGSTKYYPGHCTTERGAVTFVLKAEVAGMSKLVKAALLEQTGLRVNKIKCRGDDGDDHDDDEGEGELPAGAAPGDDEPGADALDAKAQTIHQAVLAWNDSTASATTELRKLQQLVLGLGDPRAAPVAKGLESILQRLGTVDDEAEAAATAARAGDAAGFDRARDTLVAKLRNIQSYVETDELIKEADSNPLMDIRLSETLGQSIKAILAALA